MWLNFWEMKPHSLSVLIRSSFWVLNAESWEKKPLLPDIPPVGRQPSRLPPGVALFIAIWIAIPRTFYVQTLCHEFRVYREVKEHSWAQVFTGSPGAIIREKLVARDNYRAEMAHGNISKGQMKVYRQNFLPAPLLCTDFSLGQSCYCQ